MDKSSYSFVFKGTEISMIDKKIDEKEALELQKVYSLYLDKRKENMKYTHFKVEDMFGDKISKDNISQY